MLFSHLYSSGQDCSRITWLNNPIAEQSGGYPGGAAHRKFVLASGLAARFGADRSRLVVSVCW